MSTKAYLTRLKTKSQVTIPAELRERLQLAEGDVLEASTDGSRIILEPKVLSNRSDIDAALAEALRDLKAGRVFGPFSSVKEFKAALKKRHTK